MNIESTSATITKTADASTSASSTSATVNSSTSDSASTFKDQLEAVKAQDVQTAKDVKANEEAKSTETQNAQKNATENAAQQTAKDKLTTEENTKASDPLSELNSKIATLNGLKNGFNSNTHSVGSKTADKASDKISDKGDYCQTIKMNNHDITFFVNLVDNQQMMAQSGQLNNVNPRNNSFTEIKTEATQATVQVSQTLMDALNDSAKTGKPCRIDFGSDVAVIMKVDKEGVLSANFIPGSAAVEAYLKNNIEGLKQSFDEQGLPYNKLSYSNQQQQKQQQKQKENENE